MSRPTAAGFTFVELMIATAIAATLLLSLAAASQLFGEQMEVARERQDQDVDLAVTEITDAARRAWDVQLSSSTDVSIADAMGSVTRYYLEGADLKVRRPSGVVGTLVSDVSSAAFSIETTQRVRDAAPLPSYGAVWSSPVPSGTPDTLTLSEGQTLAMGFQTPTAAPDAVNTVSGVNEELIEATLDRLLLPVSVLDGSPMEFCHLHAAGPPHNPSHPSDTGLLTLELYEATVPGDARPYGPLLASATIPTAALPAASWTWWDYEFSYPVVAPEVTDPPTGVAWGWWDSHPLVKLAVDLPMVDAPVDLTGLGALIEPGRGYTLLLEVAGYDKVSVRSIPTPTAELSGVALRSLPGGAFTPQAVAVMASLEGLRSYTQTDAEDVTTRLTLNLTTGSGVTLTGSAVVDGQVAAPNPWLGSVPGQPAGLITAGS